MSLGSKIQAVQAASSSVYNYTMIYIADYTERTKLLPIKRHVEITDYQQQDPSGVSLMDSLIIHNEDRYNVEVVQLDDSVYNNINTVRIHHNWHCEGCFSILEKQQNFKGKRRNL